MKMKKIVKLILSILFVFAFNFSFFAHAKENIKLFPSKRTVVSDKCPSTFKELKSLKNVNGSQIKTVYFSYPHFTTEFFKKVLEQPETDVVCIDIGISRVDSSFIANMAIFAKDGGEYDGMAFDFILSTCKCKTEKRFQKFFKMYTEILDLLYVHPAKLYKFEWRPLN